MSKSSKAKNSPVLTNGSSAYPFTRMRRTRQSAWVRNLVQENHITVGDLIWPMFIIEGKNKRVPVKTMPKVKRYSIDQAVLMAQKAADLGIPAIALFPNTPQKRRSNSAKEAFSPDNLVCRAVYAIKKAVPHIGIICDVALDPYTSHGHDGIVKGDKIDNDATIKALLKQSLNQAQAGCDILAPSDMMDGRIGAIRAMLERKNFKDMILMAYSAKYASAFYGPFRDAVGAGTNLKGGKETYQMNPANADEALREVALDIAEGADIVMVKPGMPYLDIVTKVKTQFGVPTFAYQVSGEYAMMMAAVNAGMLDYDKAMMESMMCFKRAGTDAVLTYFALDIAKKLKRA